MGEPFARRWLQNTICMQRDTRLFFCTHELHYEHCLTCRKSQPQTIFFFNSGKYFKFEHTFDKTGGRADGGGGCSGQISLGKRRFIARVFADRIPVQTRPPRARPTRSRGSRSPESRISFPVVAGSGPALGEQRRPLLARPWANS